VTRRALLLCAVALCGGCAPRVLPLDPGAPLRLESQIAFDDTHVLELHLSRPCELDPAPLKEIAAWTDAYREFWDASFDRLGAYLKQLQEPSGGRHGRRRKR